MNNWRSPKDSYFLGEGHMLSVHIKPIDLINGPQIYFRLQCLPERNSPWLPNVSKKKLDKFIFTSMATVLSGKSGNNSWNFKKIIVEGEAMSLVVYTLINYWTITNFQHTSFVITNGNI